MFDEVAQSRGDNGHFLQEKKVFTLVLFPSVLSVCAVVFGSGFIKGEVQWIDDKLEGTPH